MKKNVKYLWKSFRNFLGQKEKANKKEILTLFLIILIPNLLRQILYWLTSNKTGSISFIESFETKVIYSSGLPLYGFLEEIIIGVIFIYFWFNFRRLRFFSYGWVTDALFDYICVIVWFFSGATPLQLLGFNSLTRFLLREVILFYCITGPLLYKFRINIKKLSLVYTAIGIAIIIIIL